MNKIFEDNLVILKNELNRYVKSAGTIECYPVNKNSIKLSIFPFKIYFDENENTAFVRYWERYEHIGIESELYNQPISELTYEELKYIFSCELTHSETEFNILKKELEESRERERISQNIINELRERLNNK